MNEFIFGALIFLGWLVSVIMLAIHNIVLRLDNIEIEVKANKKLKKFKKII
jgi:hypothetical protein